MNLIYTLLYPFPNFSASFFSIFQRFSISLNTLCLLLYVNQETIPTPSQSFTPYLVLCSPYLSID